MKLRQTSFIAAFFTLCLLATSAHATLDKLVAIVGDDVITQSDFEQAKSLIMHMEPNLQQEYQRTSAQERKKFDDQIFHDLLIRTLIIQQANAHGVTVDKGDFQRAVEQMATNNHASVDQLYEKVSAQGVSKDQFNNYVRAQVHMEKYLHLALGQDLFVSEQDIDDSFKQVEKEASQFHLKDFWIADKTPASKKLMADFAEKLMENKGESPSDDRFSAIESEDLGERVFTQIPVVYHASLANLRQMKASQVIEVANGYHVLWLISAQRFDRQMVKNSLLNQKFAKKKQAMIRELEAMAFIKDMRSE